MSWLGLRAGRWKIWLRVPQSFTWTPELQQTRPCRSSSLKWKELQAIFSVKHHWSSRPWILSDSIRCGNKLVTNDVLLKGLACKPGQMLQMNPCPRVQLYSSNSCAPIESYVRYKHRQLQLS